MHPTTTLPVATAPLAVLSTGRLPVRSCRVCCPLVRPDTLVAAPRRLGTNWREITFVCHAPKKGPPPAESELHPSIIRSDKLTFMSTMIKDEILEQLLHVGTAPHPVRLCDTSNGADKKTHWFTEELHRVTGCWKFKNYQKLLSITRDVTFTDMDELLVALGTYATIPRSRQGKGINRTHFRYLDKVHMGIGFGDTLTVGGGALRLRICRQSHMLQLGFCTEIFGEGGDQGRI